jgi:hypothetical protein
MITKFLKGYDYAMHNITMENVVGHDIFFNNMPPYLHGVKKLKQNQTLIQNFKIGLLDHVMGVRSFQMLMA